MDPEERFTTLIDEFAGTPGVSRPDESGRRRFGSSALKINGSIFAMRSATNIYGYGQIKSPATEILRIAAEDWTRRTTWTPAR